MITGSSNGNAANPLSRLTDTPAVNQVGQAIQLLGPAALTATDAFTSSSLQSSVGSVSTDLPEMQNFPEYCRVAKDYQQFEAAVRAALAADSPEVRQRRSEVMRQQTWDHKVVELGETVMRVKARKAALRSNS